MFFGERRDFASVAAFGVAIWAGLVGLPFGAVAGGIGFKAVDLRTAMTQGAILGTIPGVVLAFVVWSDMVPLSVLGFFRPLLPFLLCTGAVALAGRLGFNLSLKR